jgi:hypothetical protein
MNRSIPARELAASREGTVFLNAGDAGRAMPLCAKLIFRSTCFLILAAMGALMFRYLPNACSQIPEALEILRTQACHTPDLVAQSKAERAEAEQQSVVGNVTTLNHRQEFALALFTERKFPEAENEYHAILDAQDRSMGIDNVGSLETSVRLAQCLQMQGKITEARPFAWRAYQQAARMFGEPSMETVRCKLLWAQLVN